MSKFEHVPELAGVENYYEWRRQIECLLLADGVYSHVSNGTDPTDYVCFASSMPTPAIASAPTQAERALIREWIRDDELAKSIILHTASSTVLSLVPDAIRMRAREIWELLSGMYKHGDISLQFRIRDQIDNLKMKGAADAEEYVAAHIAANERLARMGAGRSDMDAIFDLLRGLPSTGLWPMVRNTIELEVRWKQELENVCSATRGFASNSFLVTMQKSAFVRAFTLRDAADIVIRVAIQMLNEARPTVVGPASEGHSGLCNNPVSESGQSGLRRTERCQTGPLWTTPIACVNQGRINHHWLPCYKHQ